MAMVMAFGPEENEDCEGCFARRAIGTFNVGDVETPLCGHCCVYRNDDNTQVILINEAV